jgi:putative phosphoesterase
MGKIGNAKRGEAEFGSVVLGVVSDTHGLVRREALAALEGSERILHAGDVGTPEVLRALSRVAPVTAVRGNVDRGAWSDRLPAARVVRAGAARLYVLHDLEELDVDPSRFDAIISGRSHVPRIAREGGVLFLNPGSAGPRRFKLPVCVARLVVRDGAVDAELLTLDV